MLRFLGSLPLAMILLAVIIIACAVGTVAESRFDTAVAQAYVYDAPWFIGWLLLLCTNLICAVLLRYPWKPHQIGFIITHAGIVVLLAGAMIGRLWGLEGSVTLFKSAPPVHQLVLNQTVFEAHASRRGESHSKVLNPELDPPTQKRPVQLRLKDFQVSAIDYANELGIQTRVQRAATNGSTALRLVLRSAMVPQPITQWLLLGDPKRDTINLGPAQIRFASSDAKRAESPEKHFALAQVNESRADESKTGESREKHFVFAKMPAMNMTRVMSGRPTGIKAAFRFDPAAADHDNRKGTLELVVDQQRFEFLMNQILDRSVPLQGTAWTLHRLKFLPDFRIEGKEAVSASDLPNNPALVFEVSGGTAALSPVSPQECEHKPGECDHAQKKACCPQSGEPTLSLPAAPSSRGMTLFYGADQKLRFASVAKGQRTAEGEVEMGQEISLGLADWQVRIDEVVERAVIQDEFIPLKGDGGQPINASGVLVQIKKDTQSIQQWIAAGTPAELAIRDEPVHLFFGRRQHALDFGLTLEDFEVDRDEGTQNPASFKSRVRFVDPKNHGSLVREIWMNHPADYPDFPGVSLLGTAYKFSQASWNPNDLNQTTLQVVRDPGWSLKWIGSLLLCGGIFMMFYVKPDPHGKAVPTKQRAWGFIGTFLLSIFLDLPGLSASELNFNEAARLVIQSDGRKKPLDTFAAESMQKISGRRALSDPQTGQRIDAVDALCSMWFAGQDWNRFPVVLVSNAGLKNALGLPATGRLFSFEALVRNPRLQPLQAQIQSKRAHGEDLTPLEREAEIVFSRLHLLKQILDGEALTIVPNPKGGKAAWLRVAEAEPAYGTAVGRELGTLLTNVSGAYLAGNANRFAASAQELRVRLSQLTPGAYPGLNAIEREIHYNHLHPFRWAWLLYLGAFFALAMRGSLRAGLTLFGLGLALHVYGFGLRCWVAGRAPVTNMYESVVWVSLGVAAFALVLELIYRAKVYVLTAAPLAVLGLIFVDLLPSVFNPSIGPLPPVLRDNFWLVTHVLTITLGYAAFALAMGLGHLVLALYLFKPGSVGERSQIHQLLYRVLQIGVFLLAVGTILGGVWANYSWGRFWGWDPKETWALIALLLYVAALHGRLAGWWGNFGLSVAAAVCFNGVLMAWYGVNFVLGKGLHSYGFGGGGVEWMVGLVALDLLFIGYCVAARLRKGSLHQKISEAVAVESQTVPSKVN